MDNTKSDNIADQPVAQEPLTGQKTPGKVFNARRNRVVQDEPNKVEPNKLPDVAAIPPVRDNEVRARITITVWTKDEIICHQISDHNAPDCVSANYRPVGFRDFIRFTKAAVERAECQYSEWCTLVKPPEPKSEDSAIKSNLELSDTPFRTAAPKAVPPSTSTEE